MSAGQSGIRRTIVLRIGTIHSVARPAASARDKDIITAMEKRYDLQSIILALQHYWVDQGCVIWQPYHTEVGAGTMNPGTFLRVLGPEPWNVAYVEPSVRPDDGRYGENPNRLQQHYQFQVILKPDPGNPQERYLESLSAVGVDLARHDIRFVEDNWESPALGAWGLGWQVWLDGQEITQFTYFQQAGGINLDPVSVEITYGLERIAMPLQEVHHFRDIQWTPDLTYGDLNLQAEQEHSKYFFEIADVDRLRQLFEMYESEARAALEGQLVLPAYDYVLKCSHTFNVLDTRGAIGVTERQAYFGRMRRMSREVSLAYIEQRQRLEFPFLDGNEAANQSAHSTTGLGTSERSKVPADESISQGESGPQAFLLEIGTEELPPGDLRSALAQLEAAVPAMLDAQRLDHGEIRVDGTPRRLVVQVARLAPRQRDLEEVVKGPPAARGFDLDGNPTKAAEGFARSKGVEVEDLEIIKVEGGQYLAAQVHQAGRPAAAVLAEQLPEWIAGLKFEKSMRWNASNVAFSRPIRWLVALFGETVVPFQYAGLRAGRITRGLRLVEPPEKVVADPAAYLDFIEAQGIVLEGAERQRRIQKAMDELAAEVGGAIGKDPELLADVSGEVEAPRALRGRFDQEFLALPREVLVAVMKKHQNYFPVRDNGSLLPYFVTVCNGGYQDLAAVARGNEDVIRARFADGAFFIEEDRKRSLEDHLPVLATLIFQQDLGSMLDKTRRIVQLVEALAPALRITGDNLAQARRAAELCKADLVTNMVIEMTSLQGVMGRYYALDSGESAAVAAAIEEHYLPRFAGDALPESSLGLAVGMADRLDTLAGLFAAGLAPTGAKDPFAQRRAAMGLVSILVDRNLDFDLRAALNAAAGMLPIQATDESVSACLAFIVERLRNQLLESGARYDVVDAVLVAQGHNPASAARAVGELSAWVARDDWGTILPAYARCVRITRDLEATYVVRPDALQEPASETLWKALRQGERADRAAGSVTGFLSAFLPMIPAVDRFFEDVLVMDEDTALRENRLALLQRIAGLAEGVADLSRLEGF